MIFQEEHEHMNGKARLLGGVRARRAERIPGPAERDEQSLARHMRALAVQLRVDGRARLTCPKSLAARIQELSREAGALLRESASATPALERLHQDARIMEACAAQARLDGGARLSAVGREPRVLTLMREIVSLGDAALSGERMLMALRAFDEVQALTMAELWAVPTALRRALAEGFCHSASAVLERARERLAAERFVEVEGAGRMGDTPAFFERALQLTVERELPGVRARLEERMAQLGESGERMIRQEHEAQALLAMRLDDLIGGKRMLDALDWQKCFARLSRTEAELRADPDGTYPRMDEESQAAVREQVQSISRRLRLGEQAVARQAVAAAKEHEGARGTVCWWLYEDEGRAALAARLGARKRLPRLTPDPRGHKLIAAQALLAAALFALYAGIARSWLVTMLGVPLAWCAAMQLIGRLSARLVRPRRLLKLRPDALGEEGRLLVVVPALLSSTQRALELCDGLETLGCLDDADDAAYLLLGDFRDGPAATEADDAEILSAVRARVRAMNERAGREKYFYLHRERSFYAPDQRWMGRERKRGALMALNRLLLGERDAHRAFAAEGAACERLAGCFHLVATLDADTRALPGTVHALAGALLHPLNRPRVENGARRGYAIVQPNMELSASAVKNGFIRLFAGRGGMDGYPVTVSELYQDVTGHGTFGGKGVYDVRAFMAAVEGKLPEGRILSHDLIEGELAGAAFAGDISFYDGFPETFSSYLKRLERWTRGDWQLLPFLFRRGLSGLSRLKLLDDLLRSLAQPALFTLLVQGIWFDLRPAFALGVLYAFLDPLTHLFRGGPDAWRRAVMRLAALPCTAAALFGAVARTLFRLAFTKKHMLDWVTSADAAAGGTRVGTACRVGAILCVPGLFTAAWLLPSLALIALFLVAPGMLRDLQSASTDDREPLTARQIGALTLLARETWGFFETFVTERENSLPPDNVQVDPAVGAARRTSPTNIGLYLTACLAARALGFIRDGELRERLTATVETLERMETWRGQLYNWYDIDTLRPLRPRYVSSVDSGNLAAALLTCAAWVRALDAPLARRLRALATDMDFTALYDKERKLFRIGADVENDRLSASHYDLLASESRILSYVSMMLGQVEPKHFRRLARPCVRLGKTQALVSWSGTMFEYLMPELFMRSRPGTLLNESARAVVRLQRQLGEARLRPWGVSESGYHAFDMHLNYQYRAFGLREVALGGGTRQSVVAPYASLLALCICPGKVADNVLAMREAGWAGAYGFFEAADYTDARPGEGPKLVRSYMAHHQGMALAALANALAGDAISRCFESIPEARALSLLLEEKPSARVKLLRRREALAPGNARRAEDRVLRAARCENRLVDAHLLFGAGATALFTARGCALYAREGVLASRCFGDLLDPRGDIRLTARTERGEEAGLSQGRARFEAGGAQYENTLDGVDISLNACLSPEDGTLFHAVRLRNGASAARETEMTLSFPVALCHRDDCWAHPAFQSLFVASARTEGGALVFTRRPGAPGRCPYALAALATGGEVTWETDRARFEGREGRTPRALSGTLGCTLDPCAALRLRVRLEAGETRDVHFAVALIPPEDVDLWQERNAPEAAPQRARRLAVTQARAMLGFTGLNAAAYHLLDRASAFLLDARLAARAREDGPGGNISRGELWAMGISGDLPILCAFISGHARLPLAREAVRAHDFYRTMGVESDLVLVNDYGNDYEQPVRDALRDMIAASHLRDRSGARGGVHLLDGAQLSPAQRETLARVAALSFADGAPFHAQLRAQLAALEFGGRAAYQPMEARSVKLPPVRRALFNGYGGFAADGYAIDASEPLPAAWSNVLAGENFGMLVTERGGGFLFARNSRMERLTPFLNDPLREGWGLMLYLADERRGAYARLLPGEAPRAPFRATHALACSRFLSGADGLRFETALYVRPDADALGVEVTVRDLSGKDRECAVTAFIDWLLGVDARDAAWLRTWNEDGVCLARGAMPGVGYLAALDAPAEAGAERAAFLGHGGILRPDGLFEKRGGKRGWALKARLFLAAGEEAKLCFAVGWARSREDALKAVETLRERPSALTEAEKAWQTRLNALRVETGDEALDRLFPWLVKQALDARVRARAGLYQAGGAYGFRDQLQDMLLLMHFEPSLAREHLLLCAARQFASGDVLHWWHMPCSGVRTRISDDRLFLPYAAAAYVRLTGDAGVLGERVPYLRDVPIPEGKADWYGPAEVSEEMGTLHDHCMRAFRLSASLTGEHGLALMGAGDWNDSMDRVGAQGKGESVWLSQFLSVAATNYAEVAPDDADRAYLNALAAQMNAAVEEFGWDGNWYLRAYDDEGRKLGAASAPACRIDAICQAWAALSGLDAARVARALDAAWEQLVDEEHGLVKLLTPPFGKDGFDPGYIRAYPPGVRENGGQYTHAACWLLLACIHTGQEARAHRLLKLLAPTTHAATREEADRYRVEPYVLAGDVYGEPPYAGRGGWTWYTGAAGWYLQCVLALLGYERRGEEVRLRALLGDWPQAAVTVRFGNSEYRLVCRREARGITLDGAPVLGDTIYMRDDGKAHEAVFPPRQAAIGGEKNTNDNIPQIFLR